VVGLRAGDIITAVELDQVRKPDDLLRLLKARRQKFELQIVRDGIPLRLQFPL
jgi:type II secretory pathway component PulC